jgi:hypothetical protein
MRRRRSLSLLLTLAPGVLAPGALAPGALAHEGLHVDGSLQTCDIRFSADLTQGAFRRFVREIGDIVIHKSGGPATLPRGDVELGIAYSASPVDQRSDAWNDTFHHPDGEHDLGDAIALPMIHARVGLGRGTDLGAYFSGNPDASYRLVGLGLKCGVLPRAAPAAELAVSLDWGLLFGPDDTTVHAVGVDLHAGRRWKAITGYASAGAAWAHGVERSPLVSLQAENPVTPHWSLGLSPRVWKQLSVDLRARFASVETFELRLGHTF